MLDISATSNQYSACVQELLKLFLRRSPGEPKLIMRSVLEKFTLRTKDAAAATLHNLTTPTLQRLIIANSHK